MKFEEILSSITGISVPIFGVQWQPPAPEVRIARDLIRELEDRRVLYRPYEMEGPQDCLGSVKDMRGNLTTALQRLTAEGPLLKQLQRLRRACRHFCDIIGSVGFSQAAKPVQRSLLTRELAKLRDTAGAVIGAIALSYGLNVDDELASIIPFNNVK
jgi:hypothetical protein